MNLHEVTKKIGEEHEPFFQTDDWARIYEQWRDTRNEGRLEIREARDTPDEFGRTMHRYYTYRVRQPNHPYYGWTFNEVRLDTPLRIDGTLVE